MEFDHHMGGRVYDWIATSHLWLILISARMQQVLRDGGFTGWHTIPALVHHRKQGLLEGYGCLVVTGRTGRISQDKSRLEWRPSPVPKGRPSMVRVGLHADFSTWTGSSICIPSVGAYVLVSRAVRDALTEARITGIEFTRLDQHEVEDWDATDRLWKEMGYE